MAKARSSQTYQLTDFKLSREQAQTMQPVSQINGAERAAGQSHRTPSEHDWRWAMDRIRRGESMEDLIRRLEDYRFDKPQPQYYARRTVTRAYAQVALSRGDDPQDVIQKISLYPPRPYENGEQYARATVQQVQEHLAQTKRREQSVSTSSQQHVQQLDLGVMP
ncbi:MAG: hypothetical protein ACRD18_05290 [Terriglobia bacterium]